MSETKNEPAVNPFKVGDRVCSKVRRGYGKPRAVVEVVGMAVNIGHVGNGAWKSCRNLCLASDVARKPKRTLTMAVLEALKDGGSSVMGLEGLPGTPTRHGLLVILGKLMRQGKVDRSEPTYFLKQ